MNGRRPILVIKHGALGDLLLSVGAMRAIRNHHPDAPIVLLTEPRFVQVMLTSGIFDAVWPDPRVGLAELGLLARLAAMIRKAGFARVYDLQGSDRTAFYMHVMFLGAARSEWCGAAPGATFRQPRRVAMRMHALDALSDLLGRAGIDLVPPPDLGFLDADVTMLEPPGPFALLAPGGAAHRTEKRWPAARFAELARRIADHGIVPCVVGDAAERALASEIAAACADVVSLAGRTQLAELAALARRARFAVGNDTGPMHLFALAGCPTVTIFSAASRPERSAPVGREAHVVGQPDLSTLGIEPVMRHVAPFLDRLQRADLSV